MVIKIFLNLREQKSIYLRKEPSNSSLHVPRKSDRYGLVSMRSPALADTYLSVELNNVECIKLYNQKLTVQHGNNTQF